MSSDYPLDGQVACRERVPRWRPLCNWVITAPLYLWSWALSGGAAIVVVIGWFAILITGRLPESLGNYLMGALRYRWRVTTYLFGLTDRYPGFHVAAGYVDPGDHPAVFYSARPPARSRGRVAARAILAIPQILFVRLASIAAAFVLVIAWFAVLIMGRWPRGMRSFVVAWLQWVFRLGGYLYLIVDDYPRVPRDDSASSSPWEEDRSTPWERDRVPRGEPLPPPPPDWAPPQPVFAASPPAVAPEQLTVWAHSTPPDMSLWDPPLPVDRTPDPGEVTGPPWPRLVAASGSYRPPRMLRWPVVVAIVIYSVYLILGVVSASRTSAPPPPTALSQAAPTTPASAALGSEIIATPDGFTVSQASDALNGPMDAAQFDALVTSKGAADSLHFIGGFVATFDSTQGSDGISVQLFRFDSALDAEKFQSGLSQGPNVKQMDDPAIPGAQIFNSTAPDSDGLYFHGVVAVKADTAMLIDYVNDGTTRPAIVDDLAQQQYSQLG